jgi:toxin ParE1/3/4
VGEAWAVTVVYSKTALRQIDGILAYLEDRSPTGARSVGGRLLEVIELVASHPGLGRPTDRPRQRRIVVTPYPYVVFYRVDGPDVIIQRVRHTARRPLAGQ